MRLEKSLLNSPQKPATSVSSSALAVPGKVAGVQPTRWAYSFGGLLLLISVACVGAMLAGYAFFLPAVRSEVDLWLGRAAPSAEVDDSFQQAHLTFLLLCYAAPSGLMIGVRVCLVLARRFADIQLATRAEDEAFKMT